MRHPGKRILTRIAAIVGVLAASGSLAFRVTENTVDVLTMDPSDKTCMDEQSSASSEATTEGVGLSGGGTSEAVEACSENSVRPSLQGTSGATDDGATSAPCSDACGDSSDHSEEVSGPTFVGSEDSTDNGSAPSADASEASTNGSTDSTGECSNDSSNASDDSGRATGEGTWAVSDRTAEGTTAATEPVDDSSGASADTAEDSSNYTGGPTSEQTRGTSEAGDDSSKASCEQGSDASESSSENTGKVSGATGQAGRGSGSQATSDASNATTCPDDPDYAYKRAALLRAAAYEAAYRLPLLFARSRDAAGGEQLAAEPPSETLASALGMVDPQGNLSELEATLALIAEVEHVGQPPLP